MIYLAIVGWHLSLADIMLIILDMLLTVTMGSLIISIVEIFIKSQGALSGVCTLVSSMYGFLCNNTYYQSRDKIGDSITKLQ